GGRLSTLTPSVYGPHGRSKVRPLTGEMNVVLCHPSRRMTHQRRQRLKIALIDHATRAECMSDAIQLCIRWKTSRLARTSNSVTEIMPTPGGPSVGEKYMIARLVETLNPFQQLYDNWIERNHPGPRLTLSPDRLVFVEHDHVFVEIHFRPLELTSLLRSTT